MQLSLRTESVRTEFLAALAASGFVNRAAARAGISVSAVGQYRRRHPEFDAAVAAAVTGPAAKPDYQRWTPAVEDSFFEALAEVGNATAAARLAGVTYSSASARRTRRNDFAARWAQAKNMAAERVEDLLFDGALNGFTRTVVRNGISRTTRTQNAAAMFKLLERQRSYDRPRLLELTPEVIASGRAKFDRMVRIAVEKDREERGCPEPVTQADVERLLGFAPSTPAA